jgi:predicted GTPase
MIESHGNSSQTPDELTSTTEEHGLIILGNSGVGKSFLANILVGHEAFAHAFSSSSVTHETECASAKIDHSTITIFNIPGLIESEQERIDSNKKEIDKAFAQRPISMVIFMFGHQNGRIRDEDVATFNAINTAYPFQPESLVIVVNGLSSDRADTYEGFTLALLQRLLKGIDITNDNTCFLDSINRNDTNAIQLLKEQVFKVNLNF